MEEDDSVLKKLDAVVPAPLAQFDAFPKVHSSYTSQSEGRGFMTIVVGLLALLLLLNDIGELIWGWPDFEFGVDSDVTNSLKVNVDIAVNMPCRYLTVDLRDALGDRLFLSRTGLRRDGTSFDIGQATKLKEHSEALSVREAVAQSRTSRGFFDTILRRTREDGFKPTYNHVPRGQACRIWGSLDVKKVTANLHITTLGHGYASAEHVDHKFMNLSHVINEFSFGPHFPDMTQPLDYSFEVASDPFVAYQYFLHVVPTTYIPPRSKPLKTNQYSVTHYVRKVEHNKGTPGIFFKFDLDPLTLTIHQRTTTVTQFLIRAVGVIGGVFVCMGYAIRITNRAVTVVTGSSDADTITPSSTSSGVKVGLRSKWGGGDLRARPRSGKFVPQGSGWVLEGSPGSPYISSFGSASPMSSASNTFPGSPYMSSGTYGSPQFPPPSNPGTPNPARSSFGPGTPRPSSMSLPPRTPVVGGVTSPSFSQQQQSQPAAPGTPGFGGFPTTPNPAVGGGLPTSPPHRRMPSVGKKDD